ncbi:MAG: DUF1861 family protein [Elusimicrobiota bacterium]|nr:DUF1861 family protein [Elusimicrobiota bacterium]
MLLLRNIAAVAVLFGASREASAQIVGPAAKAGGASLSATRIVPVLGLAPGGPSLVPLSAPALGLALAISVAPAPVAAASPVTALAQALKPAPAAEMPGRLDALYSGGARKKETESDGVAGMAAGAAPAGVVGLVADYRAEGRSAAGRKLSFTGIGGRDAYNPTAPFKARFRGRAVEVLAARVEARDSEESETIFFEKSRGRWRPLAGAPRLKLQDPFVVRIGGVLVLGGVETFPQDGGLGYRTVFYRGASLSTLKRFAAGPDGMKDIRLAELPGGKLLVVTRPQGESGGRGKIAMTVLDGLGALEPGAISRATILEGLFRADEWGGANELHLLNDGRVGILGHVARFDEKGGRHYYPMAFTVDPATGRRTPMKILLERGRLPAGASKRPDLEDILFSGGLIRGKNGTAALYVGAGDAEAYRVEIADPFSAAAPAGAPAFSKSDERFLDEVQRKAFLYFWEQTDPVTGLTKDRAGNFGGSDRGVASMAATGFGLTALTIAESRGWIAREQAYARALTTLRHLKDRQVHEHGWFHHFVSAADGRPLASSEISSIDTALLLAGALTAGKHFAGTEAERLAREIYERVDFPWMMTDGGAKPESRTLSMGWTPAGFIPARWDAYSEHQILYILGLGSPTHPLPAESWRAWKRPEKGPLTQASGSLFTHQYSQLWLDLRGWKDEGQDYFVNSVEATLAHRDAALAARGEYATYGPKCWGLTACDGPEGYRPYGVYPDAPVQDGTVAPAAAGGSLAHTPALSVAALRHMKAKYGDRIWGRYGFSDAFNSDPRWRERFNADGLWRSPDAVGIDQGAILLAAENARGGGVWRAFMATEHAKRAFEKIGR